jgi:hypothetical protein
VRTSRLARIACAVVLLAGCEPAVDTSLPSDAELAGRFGPTVDLRMNGNVVEVSVSQSPEQLRRGGPIWAKAGPYIYLFTPQTQALFEEFGGVAAVRVTTVDGRDRLVARAMLERTRLNSVTWRRAINVAGRARVEATTRPNTMVDLIEFGEETTSFEYSDRYVRND